MKKSTLLLTTLFILAIVFTACSSAKSDITGEWKLISYGDAANPTPALPNVDASIKFENGQMSGNVGCNGFGGTYKLSNDKITFSGIMSTEMYCEEASIQEQGVLSIFSDNVNLQIQLNEDALVITSPAGSSVVNLVRK